MKYKHKTIKLNLTKSAREKPCLKESYWQNPIEWENHLFKEKIRSRNKNKKTASLVDAVETMKVCIYDCRKMCAKLYIEKDHIYYYRRTNSL